MKKLVIASFSLAAVFTVGTAISSLAAVPAPPVLQQQGIPDTVFNNLTEEVCRACHNQNPPPNIPVDDTYLPDRHHLLVDMTIPPNSKVPNPDVNGDGIPDTIYECLSCHNLVWNDVSMTFDLDPDFRDCTVCHTQDNEATVHHTTAQADALDCKACHGSYVDNTDDGHYIPDYQASLVTPWRSDKPNGDDTVPPNSAGTFAGNCDFCHNTADGLGGLPGINLEPTQILDADGNPIIVAVYQNLQTHHGTGLAIGDSARCLWCHNSSPPQPVAFEIRACEKCHGISSLHNIAADTDGNGVMPGAELPGFSHIGEQADCWGCHGNNGVIMGAAPQSGPTIPGVNTISDSSVPAGVDSSISMTGMNLTNYVQNPFTGDYEILLTSNVQLTDAAGNATVLTPSSITEGSLEVVIPADMAAGNYLITAVKGPKAGNPLTLTITPGVSIDSAVCVKGTLTVNGSGFSAYLGASDAGTDVSMDVVVGKGKDKSTVSESGDVVSWNDSQIVATFSGCGESADVSTVFDSASTVVEVSKK